MADSWFSSVTLASPIEVFALTQSFNDDRNAQKVNLGVGAYRTDEGKPWVLPVVRSVEAQMAADLSLNHEYLGVAGLNDFRMGGVKALLGSDHAAIAQNRAGAVQALGGTGALRIGLDFLRNNLGLGTCYVSSPTWGNHKTICKSLKFDAIKEYRYWDENTRRFDCDGMIEDLENAPERSVILLHMCAHNPTGMDPSEEQWQKIAVVMRSKGHFPFFDCAYQGFASGDLDKDAWSLRFFLDQGFEIFAAQSFSKNFGLYNERVGNLIYVTNSPENATNVCSQLSIIVRSTWSNSPAHGCRVVATVLNNPALCNEWKECVLKMAQRILQMRKMLYDNLRQLGTPGTWDHVVQQAGMFSYTGLNERQVDHLNKSYHIYMLKCGRINMCGLTTGNVEYVARAIDDAVRNVIADPKL